MSLKKIAELAGTSASTVSRVLNNHEHSCNTPGLAEKIWRIAGEMDYLPNIAARSLRMGTQPDDVPFSVDIFPARFDSLDKDFFFRELFQYIKEQLMAQGCLLGEVLKSIDIMELNEKRPQDAVIPYQPAAVSEGQKNPLAFVQRKANAGLIILGKCPKELFSTLKRRYSCIVGIDRNPTEYEYDEVICNGATAAEKAVEYLILLGHKNIAYIGDCTYESRYIGYYQALLNHKIPPELRQHLPDRPDRRGGLPDHVCHYSIPEPSKRCFLCKRLHRARRAAGAETTQKNRLSALNYFY